MPMRIQQHKMNAGTRKNLKTADSTNVLSEVREEEADASMVGLGMLEGVK